MLKHCEHPSEVEIEARLKKQLINTESIHALLHCNMQWEQSTYTEIKKISKTHRKCTYRQRTNIHINQHGMFDSSIICKSSIVKEDFNDMWCSVHVSIETPVPSMIQAIRHADPIKVRRYRTTIEGHYVDIIENILEHDLPRVEIEVCDPKEFKLEAMMVVVRRVCDIMNGNYPTRTPYVRVSFYDWKTVMHVASTQYGPFCIEKMLYQKPETMTIKILSNVSQYKDVYAVTPKVDGIRKFIILANNRVYTLGIMKDVRQLDKHYTTIDVTILDCEYVKTTNSYYVFDIAVYDGKYYGNTPWGPRQQKVEELVSDLNRNIYAKPYRTFDSFDSLKSLYEEFISKKQYDIDGLIFVDKSITYIDPVYKWKSHSTIDLELSAKIEIPDSENNTLCVLPFPRVGAIYAYTCDGIKVDIHITNPQFVLESNSFANILKHESALVEQNTQLGIVKAGVWELSYNNESNTLSILRYRPDKPQGNSSSIVQKNMYSSVPGTLFSGRGFYLMRKYHNKVKKQMIKRANDKGAKILDVGTGQGGDLGKWKRASHIFCVEPSNEATEEMLLRMSTFGHINPNSDTWQIRQSMIKVINVPLRDLDISQITEKIDIFTVFFCMNQWLPEDWSKLHNVINEKGSKKCRLLAIAMTEPEEYDSECFTIKRNADYYNISIHGTRIINIDETPVNPITLTRMMEKSCGMTKIAEEYLDTDTFMTMDERKLSSMYTMFVYKR